MPTDSEEEALEDGVVSGQMSTGSRPHIASGKLSDSTSLVGTMRRIAGATGKEWVNLPVTLLQVDNAE